MTILTEIPNGASNADVRATLNDLFTRIQTREGGTMPVLTQILNGSSLADVRATFNSALTRLAALESGGTPTPTPTPTPGLVGFYANGATNPKLKAAFAAVLAGTRRARWLRKSDSTDVGQWAGTGTYGMTGARAKRPAALIAAAYTAAGIPMLDQSFCADNGLAVSYGGVQAVSDYDPRVIMQAATIGGDQTFAGGGIVSTSGAAGVNASINFQLAGCDTFEFTGYKSTGASPLPRLLIDGQDPVGGARTLNVGGDGGLVRETIVSPFGVKQQTGAIVTGHGFAPGAPCNMSQVVAYSSAQKAWDIVVHSSLGATAAQQATTGNGYKNLDHLKFDAPDFTTVKLGINDWGQGASATDITNSIAAIVTAAKATGDVLWIFPHPVTNISAAAQTAQRDVQKAKAAQMGVSFLDLFEHFGSGNDPSFASRTKEGVHPLEELYAEIAAIEKQAVDLMRA